MTTDTGTDPPADVTDGPHASTGVRRPVGGGGVPRGRMTPQTEAHRRADLARMKRRATGLLVVVAVAWLATVVTTDAQGASGYLEALLEAAMVGAFADWFAVTAIFRHPLGLPIPHTAVVASRKDQFGATLGEFVQGNFLSADVIGARLSDLGLARRLGTWLSQPDNAERAGGHAAGLVVRLSRSTSGVGDADDADIVAFIERQVRDRIDRVDAAPVLARTLRVLTVGGHHEQVLDELLALMDEFLVRSRPRLREVFTDESPWWMPEAADDALFNRLFEGVRNLLSDAATPGGRGGLRQEIHDGIGRAVDALESDPALAMRAEEIKQDLMAHPDLRRWIEAVWHELSDQLRDQALDDTSALRQRLVTLIQRWGVRLQEDPEVGQALDDLVDRTVRSVIEQFSDEIAGLVSSTVSSWDAEETSDRLELLLGRDLQFIRINGTVVGGLAGLVIHTIRHLVG